MPAGRSFAKNHKPEDVLTWNARWQMVMPRINKPEDVPDVGRHLAFLAWCKTAFILQQCLFILQILLYSSNSEINSFKKRANIGRWIDRIIVYLIFQNDSIDINQKI